MITQTVTVQENERQNIIIGRRGTYNSETIVFDLSYLVDTYGAGQAVLMVKRPTDATAYPAVTTQADDQLIWIVGDVDTSYKGHGECELYWYVGQALAKSVIFGVTILRDIGESSETPPDPYKPWVDVLVELGAETERNAEAAAASASDAAESADAADDAKTAAETAQEAAEDAQEAAEAAVEHYPKIVDGYWYVWSSGEWVNTGTKAAGTDGKGISSIVSVKSSTSGNIDTYTMTVTYTDGTTDVLTFTVTNGVSPSVTITPIAHGHQVTITDAEHPTGQSFDVLDGEVTEAELDGVKNTLGDGINAIDNGTFSDIIDITNGGYVNTDGEIVSFSDSAYSGYIQVDEFASYRLKNVFITSSRSIYCYDESYGNVQKLISGSSDTDVVITIPANGKYIRLTTNLNGVPQILKQNVIENSIVEKTNFYNFDTVGLHREIDFWALGLIRTNFPHWSSATKIMTTKHQIHVTPGTLLKLRTGYSMIVIKSNGNATRYNANFFIDFTDDIWIEANRTDEAAISTSERPVEIIVSFSSNPSLETVYVDGANGSDINEGTQSSPLKTIMAAVKTNKKIISVKAGTYSEMVNLTGRYYPIMIQLWQMPTYSGSVEEVPKIIIDGGENHTIMYGILCENCCQVTLSDIYVKRTSYSAFYFKNTQFVNCVRCIASDTAENRMGFEINNVNGKFVDCICYNIGKDGFNIHSYGDTEFINCVAHDCADDGISHHDGCTGRIIGGEYYNNVKGGIASPTYGSYIDIDSVYCHNNGYGIYAVSDDVSRRASKTRISNSAIKNNNSYDIYFKRTAGILWNTLYATKSLDADSTLTELT